MLAQAHAGQRLALSRVGKRVHEEGSIPNGPTRYSSR
jgi:hypothetical protein